MSQVTPREVEAALQRLASQINGQMQGVSAEQRERVLARLRGNADVTEVRKATR